MEHDRWLVSYADFITLLFAFFVVMYSTAQINEGRYRQMTQSLVSAFHFASFTKLSRAPEMGNAQISKQKLVNTLAQNIRDLLLPLARFGMMKVEVLSNGVKVELGSESLFSSGTASLTPEAQAALKPLASILSAQGVQLRIEGHTDNQPVHSAQFPSNWELSSARAASVARLLEEAGMPPQFMSVAGFGPYRSLANNNSEMGRRKNRRVTLWITPITSTSIASITEKDKN